MAYFLGFLAIIRLVANQTFKIISRHAPLRELEMWIDLSDTASVSFLIIEACVMFGVAIMIRRKDKRTK